jgi:DNA-binding GntR family transcriptional regulator
MGLILFSPILAVKRPPLRFPIPRYTVVYAMPKPARAPAPPRTTADPLRTLWQKHAGSGTLAGSVYLTLREAIIEGVITETERLQENRLARSLSVSRTPVREALKLLARDGLIGIANGKGVAVQPLEARDLEELYQIRIALEPAAARLAALNASEAELEAMRAVLALAEALLAESEPDPRRLAALSGRFNDLIAEASRNGRLAALVRQYREMILRAKGTTLGQPGRARQALAEHKRLLRALESRDPDEAARAALTHLEEARRVRMQLHFDRSRP